MRYKKKKKTYKNVLKEINERTLVNPDCFSSTRSKAPFVHLKQFIAVGHRDVRQKLQDELV